MISRRRYLLAMVLALIAPGLDRVVVGRIISGILAFMLYPLFGGFEFNPWWLKVYSKKCVRLP